MMMSSAGGIPVWNGAGVLPPIRPGAAGNAPDRSPYLVDLSVFFERFSTSPERMTILDGFLKFRANLHLAGITSGFQWIDGSFLEAVELQESRAPNDMDVVTFFHLPAGQDQNSLVMANIELFDPEHLNKMYSIDGYFLVLDQPTDAWQVKLISYWYSMWSHRRDGLWKGFVQIDLDPSRDNEARAILNLSGGIHHE